MQNNQNLGNYLRALRKERDLTLHQVAVVVDVDSPLLSKLERSERLPTNEQIKRLSAFFDLNENELLAKVAAERIIKEYGLGDVTQQAVKMVQEQLVEKPNLNQLLTRCLEIIIKETKFDTDLAYNELSKVLFMKIYSEQVLSRSKQSTFDSQWLKESKQFFSNIDAIFKETKGYFGALYFENDDTLGLSEKVLILVLEELKEIDFRNKINKRLLRQKFIEPYLFETEVIKSCL